MNHRSAVVTVVIVVALLLGVAGATAQEPAPQGQAAVTAAVGTAFTYQGRLNDGGIPASSDYDFQFALYDALTGGNQLGSTIDQTIAVDDGYFTTLLDFGQVFQSDARYLEVRVRTAGTGDPFTTLTPRQALTPVPYALALPGQWTQQNATSPNLIGGYGGNVVNGGLVGVTIGGGGRSDSLNAVHDNYGTVAGGIGNRAGSGNGDPDDGAYATVGGGNGNLAFGNYATASGGLFNGAIAYGATVAGGINSSASDNASFVGGGQHNTASNDWTTVAGGFANVASGSDATVGGGGENIAAGNAATVGGGQRNHATGSNATVPGGGGNLAAGAFSLAAGRRAKANHPGSFVWGDSTDADVASTANDQFVVRASGGISVTAGTGILRLIPDATSPNLIGGHGGNHVAEGVVGATISGGGNSDGANRVTDPYGTVSGGTDNQAGNDDGDHQYDDGATVGGGKTNRALGLYSTVGGGVLNHAIGWYASIGGGDYNVAWNSGDTVAGGEYNVAGRSTGLPTSVGASTVCGGNQNVASGQSATVSGGTGNSASGQWATIGGGYTNVASGDGATVPGGNLNTAAGNSSFAAGLRAKANNRGCFVWGDYNGTDVACNNDNRWVARTSGGVYFYTSEYLGSGVYVPAGGNAWSSVSDRNAKENARAVNSEELLARLAQVPITTWNYKTQDASIRHIGPMAQDFSAAFGVGEDNTHISTVDADGVALAAIQGLYQMVQDQQAQIDTLQQQNAAVEKRLAALEQAAGTLPGSSARLPDGWWLIGGLVTFGAVAVRRRREGGIR